MRSVASDESIEWPPSMPIIDADLACLERTFHIVCRAGQHERVRVLRDHAMDDVDLLERRAHGLLALHRGRDVDRPELPADAAGAQARDVGHQ